MPPPYGSHFLSELTELEEDLEGLDAEILATGVVLDEIPETPIDNMQANRICFGNSVLLRGCDAPAFAEEAYAAYGDELVQLVRNL